MSRAKKISPFYFEDIDSKSQDLRHGRAQRRGGVVGECPRRGGSGKGADFGARGRLPPTHALTAFFVVL